MKYTAEGKFQNEKQAKQGLATCAYAGKWKSAKAGVARKKPALSGPAYWDAVRLYFLELGGEWLSQLTKPLTSQGKPAESSLDRRKAMQSAAIQASRQSYSEPQKVREG